MAELVVLVVGGGGREYELARQLSLSDSVTRLYVAPGNAGTNRLAKTENVVLNPTDTQAVVDFAQKQAIGLVVIGPEAPLTAGLSDALRAQNIPVFGPSQQAAQLEASKAFAADFMARHAIPQPQQWTVRSQAEALELVKDKPADSYVIKADGLASGKGVVLPETNEEAEATLAAMFSGQGFGGAGREAVVIQERLHGPEVSAFAVSDGTNFVLFPFTQDHKRLLDNDKGPNTGGMGAYAPLPESIVTPAIAQKIHKIAEQSIQGMAADGMPYQGVLFMGLMLARERGGDPVVIEYNVRFGDPEAEVLLPLLGEPGLNTADMLISAAGGDVSSIAPTVTPAKAALTICLAAAGYPEQPRQGDVVEGLDKAYAGVIIHHAGTMQQGDTVVASGGRVLYVTGIGENVDEAAANAYAAIGPQAIHFEGMQYRRDIGYQARKS
jgi:phosphoribosylamine--glycine ligase